MHKVREAMKSSEQRPMDGKVHVDEFVIGGKEKGKVSCSCESNKKKIACAVKLTGEGKVKRMNSMQFDNYSAKELKKFFVKHISKEAEVTTGVERLSTIDQGL